MSEITSRLIQGDCLEVMPALAAGSVAMVFADLPYQVLKNQRWDVYVDLESLWANITIVAHEQSNFVFTSNARLLGKLIESNPRLFKYDLVWNKSRSPHFMCARYRVLGVHENLAIFSKPKAIYNPQMRAESERKQLARGPTTAPRTNSAWYRDGLRRSVRKQNGPAYPISILNFADSNAGKIHPTQKPVALLEWLIKTYTNPGDTVLDPVAGSGTTAIAALRTGRHSICIEKDPVYFAAMQKRVADERAQLGLPAE